MNGAYIIYIGLSGDCFKHPVLFFISRWIRVCNYAVAHRRRISAVEALSRIRIDNNVLFSALKRYRRCACRHFGFGHIALVVVIEAVILSVGGKSIKQFLFIRICIHILTAWGIEHFWHLIAVICKLRFGFLKVNRRNKVAVFIVIVCFAVILFVAKSTCGVKSVDVIGIYCLNCYLCIIRGDFCFACYKLPWIHIAIGIVMLHTEPISRGVIIVKSYFESRLVAVIFFKTVVCGCRVTLEPHTKAEHIIFMSRYVYVLQCSTELIGNVTVWNAAPVKTVEPCAGNCVRVNIFPTGKAVCKRAVFYKVETAFGTRTFKLNIIKPSITRRIPVKTHCNPYGFAGVDCKCNASAFPLAVAVYSVIYAVCIYGIFNSVVAPNLNTEICSVTGQPYIWCGNVCGKGVCSCREKIFVKRLYQICFACRIIGFANL